jgi:hypothetical protein
MPRVSLPSHLKNLRTYTVLLTQTTEQDLLDHFRKASETYEEKNRPFYEMLDKALQAQYAENPYRRHNWRKGSAQRKFAKGHEWLQIDLENDTEYNKREWLLYVGRDLHWCNLEFKWSEKPETSTWYGDFVYRMEQCRTTMRDMEKELVEIDGRNFEIAKKEWERDDAEWIDRTKRMKEHERHRPYQFYLDECEKDPDMRAWYEKRGGIPNYEETCEFCKERKARDEAYAERMRLEAEQERLEREEEDRERQEQEALRKKPVLPAVKVVRRCEDCDYQTSTLFNFELHMKSKEHAHRVKQKSLYCACCETQCRTQIEFNNHLQTSKHKKLANPTILRCEACDYTASLKHHFEAHMTSKRHLAKVAESQSVTIPMVAPPEEGK